MEEVKFIIEQLEMLVKNGTIESSIAIINDGDGTHVHIAGVRAKTLFTMSSALKHSEELQNLVEASYAVNELFKCMKKHSDGDDDGGGVNNIGEAAVNRGDGKPNPYLVNLAVQFTACPATK